MYKVKVVAVNEVMEVEVQAQYYVVDEHNNLIFHGGHKSFGEPVAMFPASRWIVVQKKK